MTTHQLRVFVAPTALALALLTATLYAADKPSWITPSTPTSAPASTLPATTDPAVTITAPTDPKVFLTVEQLWQAYREKQYNLVIREVVRINQLPNILAGYNKFDLLTLRGESQLRLRNVMAAVEIFKQAPAIAADDEAKALAAARLLLMQRQTALVFKARTGEPLNPKPGEVVQIPPPIDVTDLDQRPAAYQALYHDEHAAALPELARIPKLTNVAAVTLTAKTVDSLWLLELAATGKHVEMDQALKDLIKQAKDLLAANLKENTTKVADIKRTANIMKTISKPRYDANGKPIGSDDYLVKTGLTNQDTVTLKDIINTLGKYGQAVKDLTARLHQDDKVFQPLADSADRLRQEALNVLSADYTSTPTPVNPGGIIGGPTNTTPVPMPVPVKLH